MAARRRHDRGQPRRRFPLALAAALAAVAASEVSSLPAFANVTRAHSTARPLLVGTASTRTRGFGSPKRTSQHALPEALLLASLDPTPTVVSMAFNVITFLPQYLWLAMVLAPNWSVTRKVMEPLWPTLLFAAVHIFIVFNVASTNSDNLSDFTELAKVFDPRVSLNLFGDFSPQVAMMNLMKSPGFVSEEWSHVLAWDLFVGRWIYLDGQRRGIFTSHSVLFCNLIGPPGLLLHAATCLVSGKGLPEERLPQVQAE
eukprot:TRINITY_DN101512_c0_g1_i1.p1 TRINITY_DN101512_c0_g1~~TRINITY_DN101512_c0_g1_i1.p1  ORF type:complete len:257 (-),score=41.21 TRINITY_DN101512_c0_g1_i1:20-790(-)